MSHSQKTGGNITSFKPKRARNKKPCLRSSANKSNQLTDPALWEQVKLEVTNGDKGGAPGKWSARKAQLAVHLYKARGGSYIGPKDPKHNSLSKWTRENWGYVNDDPNGRYLPLAVRQSLTNKEKHEENQRKSSRYGQWVPYSKSVERKMRAYLKSPH